MIRPSAIEFSISSVSALSLIIGLQIYKKVIIKERLLAVHRRYAKTINIRFWNLQEVSKIIWSSYFITGEQRFLKESEIQRL